MLTGLVILLAAIVIAVPFSKRLGFGSVLGYLAAGVAIGPSGLRLIPDPAVIADISELGVVMLLFLIGLEVRPHRLWIMRKSVFGLGGLQMLGSAALIALAAHAAGLAWASAAAIGLGLAASSTAIVLPMLVERNLLPSSAGRDGFSILLFQDLAFVPLVALIGLLNPENAASVHVPLSSVLRGVAVIAGLLLGGIFLAPRLVRLLGGAKMPEIFTAISLLIVVAAAAAANWAGLSMSLGAFLAGVAFSDSEFRHELQANVEPFEGLLLGFFFIAVGMQADLHGFIAAPLLIIGGTLLLLVIKMLVLFGVGWLKRRDLASALRLAFALPQGSEFSFVLFGAATTTGVLTATHAAQATLVVALSMMISPPLFTAAERWIQPKLARKPKPNAPLPSPDQAAPHLPAQVIICGFGRVGQIVGRVLHMHRIPFTALDQDIAQLDLVKRVGLKVFFGNPAREEVLRAAGAADAKLLVVALDNADAALQIVDTAHRHFPHLQLLVRARNRRHAHLLMDRNVPGIVRETFYSALHMARQTLDTLGIPQAEAERAITLFEEFDTRILDESHAFYRDENKLIANTQEAAAELLALFEESKEK